VVDRIDGEARFVLGDERIDAGAGDAVLLPRDVPHAYLVTSQTARLVGSAGGAAAERRGDGRGRPDLGIEILGPPPALD
jgi:hypothetical protein